MENCWLISLNLMMLSLHRLKQDEKEKQKNRSLFLFLLLLISVTGRLTFFSTFVQHNLITITCSRKDSWKEEKHWSFNLFLVFWRHTTLQYFCLYHAFRIQSPESKLTDTQGISTINGAQVTATLHYDSHLLNMFLSLLRVARWDREEDHSRLSRLYFARL